MTRSITRDMVLLLEHLTPLGKDHGMLIADIHDMPPELETLRDRKMVFIRTFKDMQHSEFSDFQHPTVGKITITQEGISFCKRALQSINHLPLFNNASKETAYA